MSPSTAASPEMNDAEFANIQALEEGMWWFRGQRKILNQLLEPVASGCVPRDCGMASNRQLGIWHRET
jgi:hypothetical protein